MTQQITITKPDDWHLHVRDGAALNTVVPHTAAEFGRAIIMPNLKPPVTTAAQALEYKQRILAAVPKGVSFEPLMTLYLTDNLPADEIARAKDAGVVAAKLYPAGATTNSDAGVTDIVRTYEVLDEMQRHGMPLLVHGEVTDPEIDPSLVHFTSGGPWFGPPYVDVPYGREWLALRRLWLSGKVPLKTPKPYANGAAAHIEGPRA